MEVLSLTEARNNLSEVFDRVYHDNEEIIIHRKARESVVVIPMEEFNRKYNFYKNIESSKRDIENLKIEEIDDVDEYIKSLKDEVVQD